jgi:hypothetical protein
MERILVPSPLCLQKCFRVRESELELHRAARRGLVKVHPRIGSNTAHSTILLSLAEVGSLGILGLVLQDYSASCAWDTH